VRQLSMALITEVRTSGEVGLSAIYWDFWPLGRRFGQSLSEATRKAYVSDWRAFEGWCADRGVEALPASPASLAWATPHRRYH
jgi:hypothetical protein